MALDEAGDAIVVGHVFGYAELEAHLPFRRKRVYVMVARAIPSPAARSDPARLVSVATTDPL